MATKVQYLDLTGLTKYDELIKNYIGTEDTKSYKVVRISGQKLQFFKSATPASDATPDTEITLPQQDISNFIEKVTNATAGNFATLNADGTISDSGKKPTDFIEEHQDISGKADKVTGATNGNFAALDANGNLTDSGKKASDFALDSKVGDLDDLDTAAKNNVVAAVNEVKAAADNAKSQSTVTIEEAGTASSGAAKTYIVKQNNVEIGKIDIPADMVVSSGTVEKKSTAGDWGEAGTYIVLTIANATNDKLYIPATSLVDIYTAQQSAAQIQLAIDSNNVISATIVDGSVDSDALAADAVITVKIADKNVTKAKLSDEVQASLGKADTALQESDFEAIPDTSISALFATA